MKKVVSQLKRTLSVVLAFMMVATSVPQTAMTVFAEEADTVSFRIYKAADIDTVTVKVSDNTVVEAAENVYSISSNEAVTIEATIVEDTKHEVQLWESSDKIVSTKIDSKAATDKKVVFSPISANDVATKEYTVQVEPCNDTKLVSKNDGTHNVLCSVCDKVQEENVACTFVEGVCACGYKDPYYVKEDEAATVTASGLKLKKVESTIVLQGTTTFSAVNDVNVAEIQNCEGITNGNIKIVNKADGSDLTDGKWNVSVSGNSIFVKPNNLQRYEADNVTYKMTVSAKTSDGTAVEASMDIKVTVANAVEGFSVAYKVPRLIVKEKNGAVKKTVSAKPTVKYNKKTVKANFVIENETEASKNGITVNGTTGAITVAADSKISGNFIVKVQATQAGYKNRVATTEVSVCRESQLPASNGAVLCKVVDDKYVSVSANEYKVADRNAKFVVAVLNSDAKISANAIYEAKDLYADVNVLAYKTNKKNAVSLVGNEVTITAASKGATITVATKDGSKIFPGNKNSYPIDLVETQYKSVSENDIALNILVFSDVNGKADQSYKISANSAAKAIDINSYQSSKILVQPVIDGIESTSVSVTVKDANVLKNADKLTAYDTVIAPKDGKQKFVVTVNYGSTVNGRFKVLKKTFTITNEETAVNSTTKLDKDVKVEKNNILYSGAYENGQSISINAAKYAGKYVKLAVNPVSVDKDKKYSYNILKNAAPDMFKESISVNSAGKIEFKVDPKKGLVAGSYQLYLTVYEDAKCTQAITKPTAFKLTVKKPSIKKSKVTVPGKINISANSVSGNSVSANIIINENTTDVKLVRVSNAVISKKTNNFNGNFKVEQVGNVLKVTYIGTSADLKTLKDKNKNDLIGFVTVEYNMGKDPFGKSIGKVQKTYKIQMNVTPR